ncbi:MAG TPA: fumarylacetoacetate hydrolase family protein [Burkholderiales bacterium]
MPTFDLEALAQEMKAAQDNARSVEPITTRFGDFDLPAAYEVARRVHEARLAAGFVPVGRKIGFTNAKIWPAVGLDRPVWAYLYDRNVVHCPDNRATCRIGRFVEPKVEPEIVVRFRSAPPTPDDVAAIIDCIDWVAHGFEIVQSRYPGWKFKVADAVADQVLHAALLVGEPREPRRLGPDLARTMEQFSITLRRNGEVRETGNGASVLGSPLHALAHLIAVLASQPRPAPIQAGELVTTGTLTAAPPISVGETWSTELEGIELPGMTVKFEH